MSNPNDNYTDAINDYLDNFDPEKADLFQIDQCLEVLGEALKKGPSDEMEVMLADCSFHKNRRVERAENYIQARTDADYLCYGKDVDNCFACKNKAVEGQRFCKDHLLEETEKELREQIKNKRLIVKEGMDKILRKIVNEFNDV